MAQTIASHHLIEKWISAFHVLDATNDGIVTVDDFIAVANYISSVTGSSAEKAEETMFLWKNWFTYLSPDSAGIITMDRYINAVTELYGDIENHKKMNAESWNHMFDLIDFNGDGTISLNELTIFYGAFGIHDQTFVERNFTQMDTDGDNAIQRKEFVEAFVRYFTDPDSVTGCAHLFPSRK